MNNPIRAHVRRGPERPEAEPEQALVMPPTSASLVTCHLCTLGILPGEPYWAIPELHGKPVTFAHVRCDEYARR